MIGLHRISESLTFKSWKRNWLKHKASKSKSHRWRRLKRKRFLLVIICTQHHRIELARTGTQLWLHSLSVKAFMTKCWAFYLKQRKKKLQTNESDSKWENYCVLVSNEDFTTDFDTINANGIEDGVLSILQRIWIRYLESTK